MKANALAWLRGHTHTFTALSIAALTLSLTSITQASSVDPNPAIVNGGFETATSPAGVSLQIGRPTSSSTCVLGTTSTMNSGCGNIPGTGMGTSGIPYNQYVTGWTVTGGLVLLYVPAQPADSSGAANQFSNCPSTPGCAGSGTGGVTWGQANRFVLWGPANGSIPGDHPTPAFSNNGLTLCNIGGCGGNYLAIDGGVLTGSGQPLQGGIEQTVNNLIVGHMYDVSFDVSSAQNWGRSGDVMTQFRVSLCGPGDMLGPSSNTTAGGFPHSGTHGCSEYSPLVDSGSHGFAPWRRVTLAFKADHSSETLSFLAIGVPEGQPPIALLDGVSITPAQHVIPEPSTLGLLGTGLIGLAGMARRKLKLWT